MKLQHAIDLYAMYPVKKRHEISGLKISIETPRGTVRSGTDSDGHEWRITMKHDYGYIRMSEGSDGDHVDCYVGPNHDAPNVYVIHQNDPSTGEYDEDKCMIGFNSAQEAKDAYLAHYDKPGFFGSMDTMSMEDFKAAVLATKDEPGMIEIEAVAVFGPGFPPASGYRGFAMEGKPTFHPPSLRNPQRVPTDSPTETDDRFLDVTKRNDRATRMYRAQLLTYKGRPLSVIKVTNIPVQESIARPYNTIYVGRTI